MFRAKQAITSVRQTLNKYNIIINTNYTTYLYTFILIILLI